MGRNIDEFVLDSKGHCFFCLSQIPALKQEPESEPPRFPKYSIHYLSRYLKMDMGKVFKNLEQIPSDLLAKVESSRLKVELCEECVLLIDQFSGIRRKLEKVELELGSCLKLLNAKFLDTGRNESGFKKLADVEPQKISSGGELEILEVLREEAFQKSHFKLSTTAPRVKLRNIPRKEIDVEKLKFQATVNIANKQQNSPFLAQTIWSYTNSSSELKATGSEIKMETSDPMSDNDNIDNCHSEDFNEDNEVMCEDLDDSTQATEDKTDMNNSGPGSKFTSSSKTEMYRKSKTKIGTKRAVWSINPETEKYKCGACSMEFLHKGSVQTHYESVHLNVRFKCVTCGKQFTQRSAYNRHQKSAHVGVRYACQVCNKSFKHTFEVRNHQRRTECGKKLGLKSSPSKI